jgi:hypothetical protein
MAKRKIWNVEIMVGLTAIIVSISALVVSVMQTRIMREQQYAAVIPMLQYYFTNSETDNENRKAKFEFTVVNKGIGPAIIKNAQFVYKGKVYDESERSRLTADMIGDSLPYYFTYSSIGKGAVMQSGDAFKVWQLDTWSENNYKLEKEMREAGGKGDFDFWICYEDVYKNAWIVHQFTESIECKSCAEMQKMMFKKTTK